MNLDKYIDEIKSYNINTEYVIVKPNWVNSGYGKYTEPEILELLFRAFPKQKKIVVESYTPWRTEHEKYADSLVDGKRYWKKYIEQDKKFLHDTRIGEILTKYGAEYINITNEFWSSNCVSADTISKKVDAKLDYSEFCRYIPQKIFDLADKATFISLTKIKKEANIPQIMVSLSIKNLFGLVPHPSRQIYHGKNDENVAQAVADIFKIYNKLFKSSLWINEGIYTTITDNCGENEKITKGQGLFFSDQDGFNLDKRTCEAVGIDPRTVPYLTQIDNV